jgi:hypothetical protein
MRQGSVGQAGRRLATTLGDARYHDRTAEAFFTRCYTLRSRLVHGAHPRPTLNEIDAIAPDLEKMVADLLAAPLKSPA